ncbi:M48 family metallopeptidase [Erythrobacter mangrovi]|uniref:M48 family metallopeptidase n=1 Tax=Erythrobacter mangrovi TaxID=2739433 RepID=A0A7D4B9Y1_9SPHN|nr:SprT family zinc-dependent metalloprotease [Erythrobacter mangrovi]QKG70406.1 M48 family metallopeptidase [Erythrobacter mangrovi]
MIDWLRREPEDPVVEIEGRVLPIELTRNARAQRLTLRLAPDGRAVRITLPNWCRTAEAVAFAHARRAWLTEQLAKVPARRDPVLDGKLLYRGGEIAVDWDAGAPRRPRLDRDRLVLGGPQDTLARRLHRWIEGEALRLFTDDARDYCARADLSFAGVRLTRARRRWGSCSSEGVLRLNWRLVQAPDTVRRSVVAHEVAHLVHFDHSPAFHALLDRLFEEDVEEANRWLSRHGRTLYATFG